MPATKTYKSGACEDIDKDGIFAKDQELKDFLTSPQAICAALQLQHAFETQHNQQDLDLEQGLSHFCFGTARKSHVYVRRRIVYR